MVYEKEYKIIVGFEDYDSEKVFEDKLEEFCEDYKAEIVKQGG